MVFGRVEYGLTPVAKNCEETPENFLSQSENRTEIMLFFEKKSFFCKCISGHRSFLWKRFYRQTDCSFGISAIFVLAEDQKILAQSSKISKVLFLLEKCPSKVFLLTRILPSRQSWNTFFARQTFLWKSEKKMIKLYFHPEKDLLEMLFRTLKDRFEFLAKILPRLRKFLMKVKKNSKIYSCARKFHFSQSVFLDTWKTVFATLPISIRQK